MSDLDFDTPVTPSRIQSGGLTLYELRSISICDNGDGTVTIEGWIFDRQTGAHCPHCDNWIVDGICKECDDANAW